MMSRTSSKPLKTLDARTAAELRQRLAAHHDSESEVWLVFHRRIPYDDAVNEALCYGWVDSLVKRLDDARYARKFTPRKPGSRWSTANRTRYAQRGYVVHGVDASADLIDVANRSIEERVAPYHSRFGNILEQPAGRYDAILCRGVLNDLVQDADRAAVFGTFAQALRSKGAWILDVREWETSAVRKAREPVFRKGVDTDRGRLTFTSITELDRENRLLLLSERHALVIDGQERTTDSHFVMRCWTRAELEASLERAGFVKPAYFGAYGAAVAVGATDRRVAVAQRADVEGLHTALHPTAAALSRSGRG